MTTLENFYFENVNPSEYKQSRDTKKKLAEISKLLDELRSTLTTEQQKEKLEQIENCQLSLIALSDKDAFIEGFKIGVKMTTEIYADTQQRRRLTRRPRCARCIRFESLFGLKGVLTVV